VLIGDLPIVVYLALLAVVVLSFVRYRGLMRGRTRRMAHALWCPMHDCQMRAELEEEFWDGRRVDVNQCSAFSPPTAVTCGKACLRLIERPRPATASSIPLLF
jgi:hypothetical protein